MDNARTPAFELTGISKAFPGVQAVRGASFRGSVGHIHGLVGENGAGKSTLMRILAGVHPPDAGEISIAGQAVVLADPHAAQNCGVAMVHQDTRLALDLDSAHNIWLGHEPQGASRLIDRERLYQTSAEILRKLGLEVDLKAPAGELSTAERQAVEIARAISRGARILILDEPTSALDHNESERLFRLLRNLKDDGVSVVFISHRLPEVLGLADDISVMKDGEMVGRVSAADATQDQLVQMMVGREVSVVFPPRASAVGSPLLVVSNASSPGHFENVTFQIRQGEIVGLGGVEGNGQRQLARALFGLHALSDGSVSLAGRPLHLRSPRDALAAGIVYMSNDRHREALMLPLSVRENIALPTLARRLTAGMIRMVDEARAVDAVIDEYAIRVSTAEEPISALSGGNQQKAAIGRWRLAEPRVLILDEPTQGIDVNSKLELYRHIRRIAQEGIAVLILSSDLIELMGITDRILVVSNGKIVRDVPSAEATEEEIVGHAVKGDETWDVETEVAKPDAGGQAPRRRLGRWRSPLVLGALMVLGLIIGSLSSPYFLTQANLTNLATQVAPLAIVVIGQSLVLLLGGVDLSIGATMSLTAVMASYLLAPELPLGMPVGIAACLGVGLIVGIFNGVVIRYLRVPDLIATLGSLFVVSGLALMVRPSPGGSIEPSFSGAVLASLGPLPVVVVGVVAAYAVGEILLQRSPAGNHLYATGSARDAAFVSGIRVERVRMFAYVASGVGASIGGLVLASRMGSGDPQAGSFFTLSAIAAPIIGGIALSGGRGTLIGAFLGAALIVGMQNLLNMLHIAAYWQYVWVGALTIVGVGAYSVDWSGWIAHARRLLSEARGRWALTI